MPVDKKAALDILNQIQSVPRVEEVEEMAKPSFFKDLIADLIFDLPTAAISGFGSGAMLAGRYGRPLLKNALRWAESMGSLGIERPGIGLAKKSISKLADILKGAKQPPMKEIRFPTEAFARGTPYREEALVPVGRSQTIPPRTLPPAEPWLLPPAEIQQLPAGRIPPSLQPSPVAGYLKRGKYTSSELEPSGRVFEMPGQRIFYAGPSSLNKETLDALEALLKTQRGFNKPGVLPMAESSRQSLEAIHYSEPGRKILKGPESPERMRRYSREKAMQWEAAQDFPEYPYIPTVDFYLSSATPEVIVTTGKVPYKVDLSKYRLYKLHEDPLKLLDRARSMARATQQPGNQGLIENILHNLIKNEGYQGYITKDQARLFDKILLE